MDIFVIHAGDDRSTILCELNHFKRNDPDNKLNALLLDREQYNWKKVARRRIIDAQCVLYVAGANNSEKSICWELKTAIKHNKTIYVIKLDEQAQLSAGLQTVNKYTGQPEPYKYKVVEFGNLMEIVSDYEKSTFGLFHAMPGDDKKEWNNAYFEQYKLFVQTSESLVSRRQNVNSFHMSIHTALLALMGAMFSLDINLILLMIFCMILCIAGIIMASSWLSMLESYGQLNSAKMRMIGLLESNLPLSLFDAEWNILDDPMSKMRYKSFTQRERIVPNAFKSVYILMIAIILIYLCYLGCIGKLFPAEVESMVVKHILFI